MADYNPGKQVGDERLDHSGKRHAGLDDVAAGGQLLDLSLGETDVDEALAALLAVAVALGSDGVGHADPITRRCLTERLSLTAVLGVPAARSVHPFTGGLAQRFAGVPVARIQDRLLVAKTMCA